MCGKVVGSFPLNAADIGSCGDRGTVAREVSRGVAGVRIRAFWGVGHHIKVMQEDPEHFFGNVDDFFTPDTVRAGVEH